MKSSRLVGSSSQLYVQASPLRAFPVVWVLPGEQSPLRLGDEAFWTELGGLVWSEGLFCLEAVVGSDGLAAINGLAAIDGLDGIAGLGGREGLARMD